jgi:hypothetical protein
MVDWQARRLQAYCRSDERFPLVATLGDNDSLTSPRLPGFEIPVVDLWEPDE